MHIITRSSNITHYLAHKVYKFQLGERNIKGWREAQPDRQTDVYSCKNEINKKESGFSPPSPISKKLAILKIRK